MKMRVSEIFGKLFRRDTHEVCLTREEVEAIASNVKVNGCGISDEELYRAVEAYELMDLEDRISVIERVVDMKLNIEQLCQRYHISRATLNRWQQKGKLPAFRHDAGGKDYLFSHEADDAVRSWNEAHPDLTDPPRPLS